MQAQACHLYANNSPKNRQNLIWTDTVHVFKDCYSNVIDIENHIHKNDIEVWIETESYSPTSRENSEVSRQNFDDAESTQDQDIMQDIS